MTIHDLANAFVDDQLDAEGLQELSQLLDQDPEARRVFVRAVDQHHTLGALLGAGRVRRRSWAPWIAAAAAVVVIATAVFLTRPRPSPESPIHPMARDLKPVPSPPAPSPRPEPLPTPVPEKPPVRPESPTPVPAPPKDSEKPAPPSAPPEKSVEPPAVEPPKPAPAPAPAPPPARTLAVLATIESAEGKVHRGRLDLKNGDTVFEGDTIEATAGRAALTFPDGSRIELTGEMTLPVARRISLASGTILAEIGKQPPGSPLVIATPHAEAAVLGTKLRIAVGGETKLEVKEGRVKLTRLDDNRSLEVAAGHFAVAAKGAAFAAKRTTRGPMMAGAAIWGEDFQDARAVEKDWRISRNAVGIATAGSLEFDLHPAGDGGESSLVTEAAFATPIKITAEVEFTQRLRGVLAALRLQAWKEAKEIVHLDLDEDRYYLTVGDKVVTADAGRKNPHRERWTLELRGDGSVTFSVDGRELLRGKRDASTADYHLTLLARSKRETPAGAKLRFENLVIERVK